MLGNLSEVTQRRKPGRFLTSKALSFSSSSLEYSFFSLSQSREGSLEWGDERINVLSLSSVGRLYGKKKLGTGRGKQLWRRHLFIALRLLSGFMIQLSGWLLIVGMFSF